jgi:hypothetical protein
VGFIPFAKKRHDVRNAHGITFYYMKPIALLTITFCLLAGNGMANAHRPVSVLAVRNDLFYFKVDKLFIGAVVEVYSSTGDLVLTQTVTRHKMLIDFYEKQPDAYTIKIKSKCTEINYLYTKLDEAGMDAFKPLFKQI